MKKSKGIRNRRDNDRATQQFLLFECQQYKKIMRMTDLAIRSESFPLECVKIVPGSFLHYRKQSEHSMS